MNILNRINLTTWQDKWPISKCLVKYVRHLILAIFACCLSTQSMVMAADVTWTFSAEVSYTDLPSVGQIGDLIEIEFSIDENAVNIHPSPTIQFLSTSISGASASINGVSVFNGAVASSIFRVTREPIPQIYNISWRATDSAGSTISAFFRLPSFVLPSSPQINSTFVFNMITLANASSLGVSPAGSALHESISGVPLLTYTYADAPSLDTDNDTIVDEIDNCTQAANADQFDADGDGFGNACDPDYDNDCAVTFLDFSELVSQFLAVDVNLDLSGDGVVNFIDVGIFTSYFSLPPGPSAVASCD